MASKIDIANYALSLMGEEPITSFTENTRAAIVMNLRFDPIRNAVMRAHPWNFAMKRANLSKLPTAPAFGYAAAFQLPSDFLRISEVNRSSTPVDYRLEQQGTSRVILINADAVELRYVALVTDTSKYDPLFVEALAARMAADTVYKITADPSLVNQLFQLYLEKLAEARSIDSMEDPSLLLEAEDFLEARLGPGTFRPIESA